MTEPREKKSNKMRRSLQPLRPSSQSAKIARRKEFGQNLISLIHEIDKRVENQMWQETVNYVPLISYLGMVPS